MSDPARAEIEIEVRYAETDQMGVVHHSNYLVWFELARTSLCSLSGYHYADIENLGYLLMVTGAELNYRRSARYGDTVTVSCWIDRLGSRGLTFGYEVVLDGQLLATGKTRHVWIEVAKNRPSSIPEVLREPFGRLASGSH
jgi:acyl-CoA thioester hydrolase